MLHQLFSIPILFLSTYGYVALFIWSLLEGEIGLMLAGYLASTGRVFSLEEAYFVAISGAFIGDNAIFVFGRLFERRAKRWLEQNPSRKRRVLAWFQKWSAWLIIFERFIYGTHIPALLTVSMSGYSYLKFLLFDIIGIVLWAALFLSLGYFFGQDAIELILFIQKNIFLVIFILIIFILLFIAQMDDKK